MQESTDLLTSMAQSLINNDKIQPSTSDFRPMFCSKRAEYATYAERTEDG